VGLEVLKTNLARPSRPTNVVKARDSKDVGLSDARCIERAEFDGDESCTNASVTIAIRAHRTPGKDSKSRSIEARSNGPTCHKQRLTMSGMGDG
jgi:hypothetical protein